MKTSFPKDKIRVLLLESVHARASDAFENESFRVESVRGALSEDELCERIGDAHLVGIRSKTQISERVLDEAKRLLAVGCFCIGTNQVDLESARARGVPVFNSPFSNTRSVAELVIAQTIALNRRLLDRSGELHRGEWNKSASGAHEVRHRTLGIIGYGHIGSQVSVLGEALGMRVLYYDVIPKLPLGNARQVGSLDELLEQSDVVTLHVPADASTSGLIGEQQLARMKAGAMLLNNARGSIVDLGALARALKDGRIGGAALDVFPEEPKSGAERFQSPIQGLPNVILTPHIGGSTEEAQENIALDVSTKLTRFVNIGSTTGAVNVPEVELPSQPRPDGGDRAHRILHFHKNVPGVLSKMHHAMSELGANVSGEYLRTDGELGYVVLDVDPTDGEALMVRLRAIPETVRTRILW